MNVSSCKMLLGFRAGTPNPTSVLNYYYSALILQTFSLSQNMKLNLFEGVLVYFTCLTVVVLFIFLAKCL